MNEFDNINIKNFYLLKEIMEKVYRRQKERRYFLFLKLMRVNIFNSEKFSKNNKKVILRGEQI